MLIDCAVFDSKPFKKQSYDQGMSINHESRAKSLIRNIAVKSSSIFDLNSKPDADLNFIVSTFKLFCVNNIGLDDWNRIDHSIIDLRE